MTKSQRRNVQNQRGKEKQKRSSGFQGFVDKLVQRAKREGKKVIVRYEKG